MLYQCYDPDTLEQLTAPRKVCALCDANFAPTKGSRMVKVEQVDGKAPETPTYLALSDRALNRIMEAVRQHD